MGRRGDYRFLGRRWSCIRPWACSPRRRWEGCCSRLRCVRVGPLWRGFCGVGVWGWVLKQSIVVDVKWKREFAIAWRNVDVDMEQMRGRIEMRGGDVKSFFGDKERVI